jgi:AcrR family transcriptional regulator
MAGQAGFNREAVVDTAAVLAEEHGLQNVTLALLAGELGIRSQSLYAHVDGIDGLRRELGLRGLSLLADRLRSAVMARAGRDALSAWAHAFADFGREHPALYEASVRGVDDDAEIAASSRRAMEPLTALLHSYGLDDQETIHRYRMIWLSLHGFVSLRSAGAFTLPADPDDTLERLIEMLADDLDRVAQR